MNSTIRNAITAIVAGSLCSIALFAAEPAPKTEIVWTQFDRQQKIGLSIGASPVKKLQPVPLYLYVRASGDQPPSIPLNQCIVTADTTKLPKRDARSGDAADVSFTSPENRVWKATETPHTFKAHLRSLKFSRIGQWGISVKFPTSTGERKTQTIYFTVTE